MRREMVSSWSGDQQRQFSTQRNGGTELRREMGVVDRANNKCNFQHRGKEKESCTEKEKQNPGLCRTGVLFKSNQFIFSVYAGIAKQDQPCHLY